MKVLLYLKSLNLKRAILNGDEFSACCPFHRDSDPSFSFNLLHNVYNCFGCGVSGDLRDFVRRIEKQNWKEVYAKLKEDKYTFIKKIEQHKPAYILEDLYSQSTEIDKFGLDFVDDKIRNDSSNFVPPVYHYEDMFELRSIMKAGYSRVVFPWWSYKQHNLVALQMRRISSKVKEYNSYGETKKYLYGEWLLRPDKDLVVVEGCFDVIGLSRYVDNVVAVGGTDVPVDQLMRIRDIVNQIHASVIYLLFDPDSAGIKKSRDVYNQLTLMGLKVVEGHTQDVGYDPKKFKKGDFQKCLYHWKKGLQILQFQTL